MNQTEQKDEARKIYRAVRADASAVYMAAVDAAGMILDEEKDCSDGAYRAAEAIYDRATAVADAICAETEKAGLAIFNATLSAIDAEDAV